MYGDELSERKKIILKAIIDAHIAYGEPVGSKYLSQSNQLCCSPATIRNEMAELEEMGYLEQLHTSSGRIPSELGYKFYVDSLVKRYVMTTNEIEEIDRTLHRKLAEVDQILAEASKLASSFTNYTGIAVKPKRSGVTVKRFECVYIDAHNFILVMIFPDGNAKTKSMHTAFATSPNEIARLSSVLNSRLADVAAEDISLSLMVEMESLMENASMLVNPIVKAVYETIAERGNGDVRIDGVNNLLRYPEYSEAEQMKNLLGFFDQKERLIDLVSEENSDGVTVKISKGNPDGVMNNSALVYRTIKRDGRVVGAIGVIGPCRMNYSKVISTIERLASGIDSLFNPELEDGSDKEN